MVSQQCRHCVSFIPYSNYCNFNKFDTGPNRVCEDYHQMTMESLFSILEVRLDKLEKEEDKNKLCPKNAANLGQISPSKVVRKRHRELLRKLGEGSNDTS